MGCSKKMHSSETKMKINGHLVRFESYNSTTVTCEMESPEESARMSSGISITITSIVKIGSTPGFGTLISTLLVVAVRFDASFRLTSKTTRMSGNKPNSRF